MATGKEFWDGIASGEITSLQVNTFTPFQSPIDFKMINNSDDLRKHNKQHNVEQVGNEYVQLIKDKKEERDAGIRDRD